MTMYHQLGALHPYPVSYGGAFTDVLTRRSHDGSIGRPELIAKTPPPTFQEQALSDIVTERRRQDAKWGSDRTCSNPNMPDSLRFTILVEEVGEVAKALNEGDHTEYEELIHVAAVATAWAEGILSARKDA